MARIDMRTGLCDRDRDRLNRVEGGVGCSEGRLAKGDWGCEWLLLLLPPRLWPVMVVCVA